MRSDDESGADDLVAEAVADLTGAGLDLVTLTIQEGIDSRTGLVSVDHGVVVVADPGLPTNPDYPPTDTDGTTYFTASAAVASVEVSVGVDESTGRTDLAYRVWMN